jgi:hypothetical protein
MEGLEPATRLGRRVTAGGLVRGAGRRGAPGEPRLGSLPVAIQIVAAEVPLRSEERCAEAPGGSEA